MTTEVQILPDTTVATVADCYPETIPVLARHGIDRCCGGRKTLEFVARAHGLDLAQLLLELEQVRRP